MMWVEYKFIAAMPEMSEGSNRLKAVASAAS
jgi:hypothetical protein